jgi:hypothetical protein
MKVKAIKNTSKDLSKKFSITWHQNEITIGETYTVYGIIFSQGFLSYLINNYQDYTIAPAEFFRVLRKKIPPHWYFSFDKKQGISIWGYKELALNKEHYFELELRDSKEVMNIFQSRKNEIDEWEKTNER